MKAMRNFRIREIHAPGTRPDPQAGAGILGVIAVLGLTFALVQGTVFYRAKSSAKFQTSEKGKIQAQQAADAGVEATIADLGSRKVRVEPSMHDYVVYNGKSIGNSTFTTKLTAQGMGPGGDTIQLVSRGTAASNTQMVRARMRLKYYLDTNRVIVTFVPPTIVITPRTVTEQVATLDTVVQDPETMPALNTTAAYAACMSSSAKKCDVCHIPGGNPDNRHVINVSKSAIGTHIGHHGDYITTDGTCDIYNPRVEEVLTTVTHVVQDTVIVDNSVYVDRIDTTSRVQILSWK